MQFVFFEIRNSLLSLQPQFTQLMEKKFLKLYILSFVLFSDFMMFAQPGDESDGGDLEDDDAPQAPINGKLMWLAIAGILFAMYVYRRNRKTA